MKSTQSMGFELDAETDKLGESSEPESWTSDGIPDNFMGEDRPTYDGSDSPVGTPPEMDRSPMSMPPGPDQDLVSNAMDSNDSDQAT